jgi:hypothetical protein
MKKIVLIFSLFCLTTSVSYAQVNLELKGSFVRNLDKDLAGNTFGTGFTLEFGGNKRAYNLYAGASYNFPITVEKDLTARASNSSTNPSTTDVMARYELTYYRFEVGGRVYLVGDATNQEYINFHVNLGGEFLLVTNKAAYQDFDRSLYSLGWFENNQTNEDGTYKYANNLMFVIGTGIDRKLGVGNIFLSASIAIPAPQNSDDLTPIAPIPVNVNLGYKIFLRRKK